MMKKLMLAMAILVSVTALNAQKFGASPEDSLECIKNLSLYQDYYRQKQFDESLNYWRNVYTYCPKVSKGIYIKGVKLYEKKIKKTKEDKVLKELLIDTLMMVYDARIVHFGERGLVLGRKAADVIQHRSSEVEAAYKMFEESLELQGNDMEAGALVYMYQTKYKMFKKDLCPKDEVINLYPKLKSIADYNVKNSTREKDRENYQKTSDNLLEFFKQVAECEDLVKAFKPKFEKDPENLEQLKEILSLLNTKECEDADFYITIAKKLQEKEPSAIAALSIANWYYKKSDLGSAIKFYDEAYILADKMEDQEQVAPFTEKAALRSGLCHLSSAQYASAKQKALKVLSINPNSGKAYMMLGDAYLRGANAWGENACEKGAGYWAAVDKYQVAASKDPDLRIQANKNIAEAKSRYPEKSECFFIGKNEGDEIKVGSWINETTKVRF
jgi:tetratricopeptide (TPR) repeat protein